MILEIEIHVSHNPLLSNGLWSLVKLGCQRCAMLFRSSGAKTMIIGSGIPGETDGDQKPQPAGKDKKSWLYFQMKIV